MACSLQATLAANTCAFSTTTTRFSMKHQRTSYRSSYSFTVRASSDDPDCNEEECAPDKEVGKVSVEWLAGEKTKVVGTYPPRRKQGWTGYVEKDTAGQTNIYSVEPVVYVAESAISSGSAGSSSDGAENTAAIAAGLALISIAAASSILLQVGKNPPQIQTAEYSGPSLSYYINKFKPPVVEVTQAPATTSETESASAEITQASVTSETESASAEITQASATSETESSSSVQPESTPQVQVESQIQLETSSVNTVS